MMVDYFPFNDRRHFLRAALTDALSWEESRVEAGCDQRPEDKKETAARIKVYRRELKKLNPGAKTPNEVLNDHLDNLLKSGEGQMMTIQEIHAANNEQLSKKRKPHDRP